MITPDSPPESVNRSSAPLPAALTGVRYSLPDLLTELQNERAAGSFAMEKLHQIEIGKLFQNRKPRRANRPSS